MLCLVYRNMYRYHFLPIIQLTNSTACVLTFITLKRKFFIHFSGFYLKNCTHDFHILLLSLTRETLYISIHAAYDKCCIWRWINVSKTCCHLASLIIWKMQITNYYIFDIYGFDNLYKLNHIIDIFYHSVKKYIFVFDTMYVNIVWLYVPI